MGKRILCIGDSNTWGYIPGSGERYEKNDRRRNEWKDNCIYR